MLILLAVILAYVLGSLPMGYLVVRAATGQDVRLVGSGRTGGTNAMRAAGPLAGALTGALDVLKGAAGVGLARWPGWASFWATTTRSFCASRAAPEPGPVSARP